MEEHCAHTSANESVRQSLIEMDWERGLWCAAFYGEKDRVLSLLDEAKNTEEAVNTPDNAGYTALHYAARKGHVDICRILLSNGASIDAQTRSGKATPLHKAALAGNLATVKFLIQSGAQLDAQDVDGATVLHKALQNKNTELADILLETCPRLANIRDSKGCLATYPSN